jgi:hypothetical protein
VTPPLIIRRIDAALATMRSRGMAPRAIYLTPSDHKLLARAKTTRYRRETGSKALLWPVPISHDDVPIIAEKLIGNTAMHRWCRCASRRKAARSGPMQAEPRRSIRRTA